MKRHCICIYFLLCGFLLWGQNPAFTQVNVNQTAVDSLHQHVNTADPVSDIDASIKLIQEYTFSQSDSALYYYNQTRPQVESLADAELKKEFFIAGFDLAGNPTLDRDQRYDLLTEAATYAEQSEDFYFLLHVHRRLSHLFYHASQLDESLVYQFKALNDTKQPGVPAYAKIFPYISLAHIYGDRPEGMLYADTAISMINAGKSFPPRAQHWLYTHLGSYFQRVGRDNRALAHFEKAVDIVQENDEIKVDPYLYLYFGKVYTSKRDFEKASAFLNKAHQVFEENPQEMPDIKIDIAEAMIDLAELTNQDTLAENAALKIIADAPQSGYLEPLVRAHRTLYDIYSSRSLPGNAQVHLSQFFALSDSLALLEEVNTKYFQARALELTMTRSHMEVIEADLKLQKNQTIAVTIILILASILLLLAYLSWNNQKRHYAALSQQKNQIEESNKALVSINEQLIDAKKRIEESDRLKTSILQNMSHEIRTPLTSILGYAEMISDEKDEHREIASHIQRGGRRLMHTLTSVMDLAQLEGGEARLNPDRFDLNAAVREAIEKFKPAALENGVDLFAHPSAHKCLMVNADRVAMLRILKNLLHNAIQFTPAGNIKVTLDRVEHEVILSVEDSGIGMDSSFLPEAFEPFRQESTGHGRTHEGIGLGLPITRHLVELMNGRITVTSKKGIGTTFTLKLPIVAI